MSTTINDTIEKRTRDLHDFIAQGRIEEALREFYAEDVSFQENLDEPMVGLEANLERERAWLATIAEWRGFEVKAIAVDGHTSFAETSMDYLSTDGEAIHSEQVSRAVWKDGKIVNERFYHG